MGGKNKQRTKGNVRPSSSGRAADLLARESGVIPGFVGFGISTSNEPGYVPAVHGAEEIDHLVDADFRLVLRKLSKRDAVTKLKAVQEFGAMCQERESDIVKGVLPYWPRIYCKISLDHDRRVREATQQAFEQLILKVKRNLAPYLKGIMGHWIIAQCDTYSPAASAASVAFQTAFPLNKQPEALSFCKDEVLNVLQDNLLKETADTLSDPQSIPEEEREAKYMRLLTSSLLALKRLLVMIPQTDREALGEHLAHVLSQGKFWKYSKHKTPQVRGAFFEVVAALCELAPQLVEAEAARACSAVLLSIDDADPVVLPPLWEAVLHILSSIEDCWTHVNARKGVLPKLWVLLKEGGHGLATALHPNMLPFISKLPAEVTEPKLDFCRSFFTSIIQGLSSERAVASPSECAAIVFATMECLRFLLLQNAGEEPEQRAMQTVLISEQLLPLIDKSLGNPALQSGPLFLQITEMLVSWEKRTTGNDAKTFQRLLVDFWDGLGSLCVGYVDQEQTEQVALEGVASLLQIMQNPCKQVKRKKSVKICFSDQEAKGQGEDPPSGTPPTELSESQGKQDSSLRSSHLLELVCQLAELNMVYVCERNSERHLHFLALLLRAFPKPQVFQVLLKSEDGKPEQGLEAELGALTENPAVRFLLQRVVMWLRQDDRQGTDFLVDMVFSALHCCNSKGEQTLVLNHLTVSFLSVFFNFHHYWVGGLLVFFYHRKCTAMLTLSFLLTGFVSDCQACADAGYLEACRGWLKGSVLGERLVGLAGELCAFGLKGSPSLSSPLMSQNSHSWPLISLALSQQSNNESLIGKVYVEQIIERLHATLTEAKGMSDAGNMEPLVSFICDVASNFFSSVKGCLLLAAAEELVLTIFQLCALDQTLTHLSGVYGLHLMTEEIPGVELWKVKDMSRLPAHLCASAVLGKIIFIAVPADTQQEETDTSELPDLRHTVAEILYALQWCEEMEHCPAMLAEYYKMLQDWNIAEKTHSNSSAKAGILETLFTSFYPLSEQSVCTIQVLCSSLTAAEREGLIALSIAELLNWQEKDAIVSFKTTYSLGCFLFKNSLCQQFLQINKQTLQIFTGELKQYLGYAVSKCCFCFCLNVCLICTKTASESSGAFWNPWVQQFVCANCELIVRLTDFFIALPAGVAEQLPSELSSEWQEFFVEGIHNLLLPLLVKIPVEFPEPDEPLFPMAVVVAVGNALSYIPIQLLTQNKLPARFVADQNSSLPDALQTLLNTLGPLLLFKARPLQLAVYHMLHKIMPLLPESDRESATAKSEDEDEEEPCLSPPAAIMTILTATEELLENILGGVQVGGFAVVQPLSMEHCCILGYLLAWKLLLTFFKAAPSQLRVQYSLHLRKTRALHKLLLHLFRLMPENPALPGQPTEMASKDPKSFFTENLSLSLHQTEGLQCEVPHLACSVYYGALKDLPAMVRLWWNSQEKRVFSIVDKFTSKYVSSVLSLQEITSVQSSTQTFENMTVKARSATREVIATYSVDDIFIELVIQLPQNYPLGSISVESGRRVGVAVQQWRNWMLQLSTYLTNQNGSIMEGLSLWKNNVDKRFEGVEDCMICFSVIHGSNYSLPKKACRTCKKKFHSACLYKWFTSSNKSTCPLCRETFF
uniref:E3 ubiquitin-protein ligase listerin n=1 Tax=Pygocentrus nattereri TaxID=42514 RepID=A0AAR2KB62_PYGNA